MNTHTGTNKPAWPEVVVSAETYEHALAEGRSCHYPVILTTLQTQQCCSWDGKIAQAMVTVGHQPDAQLFLLGSGGMLPWIFETLRFASRPVLEPTDKMQLFTQLDSPCLYPPTLNTTIASPSTVPRVLVATT